MTRKYFTDISLNDQDLIHWGVKQAPNYYTVSPPQSDVSSSASNLTLSFTNTVVSYTPTTGSQTITLDTPDSADAFMIIGNDSQSFSLTILNTFGGNYILSAGTSTEVVYTKGVWYRVY